MLDQTKPLNSARHSRGIEAGLSSADGTRVRSIAGTHRSLYDGE